MYLGTAVVTIAGATYSSSRNQHKVYTVFGRKVYQAPGTGLSYPHQTCQEHVILFTTGSYILPGTVSDTVVRSPGAFLADERRKTYSRPSVI